MDPVYADTLVDGVFKKRRPSQRGNNLGNSKNTSAPFRKKVQFVNDKWSKSLT